MKKVPKDLLPMRETTITPRSTATEKSEDVFAICLETDDIGLLIPLKTYQVSLRGEKIRVIDEKGEVAIYPREFFLALQLPQEDVTTLSKVYAEAA